MVVLVVGCDTLSHEAPPREDGLRFDEIEGWGFHQKQAAQQKAADSEPPSPYAAFASERTTDGPTAYRYRSFYLYFPDDVVAAANGELRHYSYRLLDKNGTVLRVFNAVVPDTEEAVDLVHRQISYEGTPLRDGSGATSNETTMGQQALTAAQKAECDPGYWQFVYIPEDGKWYTEYVCEADGGGGGGGDAGDFETPGPVDDPWGDGGGGSGGGGTGPGGDGSCIDCQPPPEIEMPPASAPDGVSQDIYDQLNLAEKFLCHSYPVYCAGVYQYAVWASNWSANTGLGGAHNGPQDAVRHAAWSGRITMAQGASMAKLWTDAHEWDSPFAGETAMDQHNNAVGRTLGSQASSISELTNDIMQAYENGDLCTSLDDC